MSENYGTSRKLIAVIATTLIIMALVLSGIGGEVLTSILSLPFVLVLPGYALTKALFPDNKLELGERVALILGLSLATASIGGLALNWSPWKLQTVSWTILLGSVTTATSLIALLRKPEVERQKPLFTPVNVVLTFNQGLLLALAGLGIATAFILAYMGEVMQNNSGFTQMWMLPDEDAESTIIIGINSLENDTLQYRLLVHSGGETIEEIPLIELAPEETWTDSIFMANQDIPVTAELYRLYESAEVCAGDDPPTDCQRNNEIYREVTLYSW